MNVQMVTDGANGALLTWMDSRNGSNDIYAQRISSTGGLLWNADGVAICTAASDQFAPRLIPDGSGGAIIAWYDNRAGNYDVYVQRIDANGIVQWDVDGIAICNATGAQNAQQLISDGAGGAIIVWSDGRVGSANADILAQRIDASGAVQWAINGVSVCNAASLQNIPQLVSDGVGGAIITWEDWRNFGQSDIYAQRISAGGFASWSFNGVVICSEPNFTNQYNARIISDASGGVIISWLDQRNFATSQDIYAQRVNAAGTVQWINNGLAVCTAVNFQGFLQMTSDGAGGAILAWEDRRTPSEKDIYAQRINSNGASLWSINGLSICNQPSSQEEPQLIPRTSGGAILTWTDSRNGSQQDIYAQSIDLSGAMHWVLNGVPVAIESTASQSASQLITNGANGAIIAWQDLRSATDYDIYASALFSNGTLPVHFFDFTANNSGKKVILQWKTGNELDNLGFEIQRAADGLNWSKLNFVPAKTTAVNTKQYTWDDILPLAGKAYYRLKQIDNSGRFAYSKVVLVDRNHLAVTMLAYPNPAREKVQVAFGSEISNGRLQLYNSSGHLVLEKLILSSSSIILDVASLKSGAYFLKLSSKKGETGVTLLIR